MCETQNEIEIGAANLKRLLSLYNNDRILCDYTDHLLVVAELHGMWESDMNLSFHKARYYKSLYAELLPIAWHPDRVIDWCIDEDEKRDFYFDR